MTQTTRRKNYEIYVRVRCTWFGILLPENAGRTVKIIALTANVIQGVENEYIAAGMDDWLFKPVKQEQLKGMILKHLRT